MQQYSGTKNYIRDQDPTLPIISDPTLETALTGQFLMSGLDPKTGRKRKKSYMVSVALRKEEVHHEGAVFAGIVLHLGAVHLHTVTRNKRTYLPDFTRQLLTSNEFNYRLKQAGEQCSGSESGSRLLGESGSGSTFFMNKN
jgi:hypothetical protein